MSFIDKFKRKEETPKESASKSEPLEETQHIAKGAGGAGKKNDKKVVGVLVKPLVTEKAAFIGQYGQYIFEVAPQANKISIAKAIQSIYGVKPQSINIIHVRGKKIRYGKTSGVTKNWKKAIVTLKPGDKIEIHEGV